MTAQMQPHQQRVVDEKTDLDVKISALSDFIRSNPAWSKLPEDERIRLSRQRIAMAKYSDILAERIAAF